MIDKFKQMLGGVLGKGDAAVAPEIQSIALPDPAQAGEHKELVTSFLKSYQENISQGFAPNDAILSAIHNVGHKDGSPVYVGGNLGTATWLVESGLRAPIEAFPEEFQHEAARKIVASTRGLKYEDFDQEWLASQTQTLTSGEKFQEQLDVHHSDNTQGMFTAVQTRPTLGVDTHFGRETFRGGEADLVEHWVNLEKNGLGASAQDIENYRFNNFAPVIRQTIDERLLPFSNEDFAQWKNNITYESHRPKVSLGSVVDHAQKAVNLNNNMDRGTAYAQATVAAAQGDVSGAALAAGTQAAQDLAQTDKAKELGTKAGAAALAKLAGTEGLEFVAKRLPVVGAVVTGGFALYEAGDLALDGKYKEAGAAAVVGAAETVGNIVGFGVGDGLREATREGIIAVGGEDFEQVEKSGLRSLGEGAYEVIEDQIESLNNDETVSEEVGTVTQEAIPDVESAATLDEEDNTKHFIASAALQDQLSGMFASQALSKTGLESSGYTPTPTASIPLKVS